jgi:hypothetical protein
MTQSLADALWPAELDGCYDPDDGKLQVHTPHWRELTPGVIDGEAVAYFGYGACALLAVELHRITGWAPAVVCVDDHTRDGGGWVHAGVLAPDGRFVDIHGARDRQRVVADWASHAGARVQPLGDEPELLAFTGDDFAVFSPWELAAAHDFATLLIAQTR